MGERQWLFSVRMGYWFCFSAPQLVSWELHPCWICHLQIRWKIWSQFKWLLWAGINGWQKKMLCFFFLTIMYSSLVFYYFLYSRVQVPFCSLFLFLFSTRAAGRLDVQFWMWCCHSALLKWENAVELLKGYSGLINMWCLVCRLNEQEDMIVIQSSPELWVGWFNLWSVVFLLMLRKACFKKQW